MPENDEHKPAFTFSDNPKVIETVMTTAVTACNRWVERNGRHILQFATLQTYEKEFGSAEPPIMRYTGWIDVPFVEPEDEHLPVNMQHQIVRE